MVDLKVEQLRLNIEDTSGQEHRVHPIVLRAVALLADRLNERLAGGDRIPDSISMTGLSAKPTSLNLAGMSNEQAAEQVAQAWLHALALKLKI